MSNVGPLRAAIQQALLATSGGGRYFDEAEVTRLYGVALADNGALDADERQLLRQSFEGVGALPPGHEGYLARRRHEQLLAHDGFEPHPSLDPRLPVGGQRRWLDSVSSPEAYARGVRIFDGVRDPVTGQHYQKAFVPFRALSESSARYLASRYGHGRSLAELDAQFVGVLVWVRSDGPGTVTDAGIINGLYQPPGTSRPGPTLGVLPEQWR